MYSYFPLSLPLFSLHCLGWQLLDCFASQSLWRWLLRGKTQTHNLFPLTTIHCMCVSGCPSGQYCLEPGCAIFFLRGPWGLGQNMRRATNWAVDYSKLELLRVICLKYNNIPHVNWLPYSRQFFMKSCLILQLILVFSHKLLLCAEPASPFSSLLLTLALSCSLCHAHTHTHTHASTLDCTLTSLLHASSFLFLSLCLSLCSVDFL